MSTMRKKKPTAMSNVLGGAKKTEAKPAAKKSKGNAPGLISVCEPKSVRIEKAGNGYTVSTYDNEGPKSMVAKSMQECMSHVKGMMGE